MFLEKILLLKLSIGLVLVGPIGSQRSLPRIDQSLGQYSFRDIFGNVSREEIIGGEILGNRLYEDAVRSVYPVNVLETLSNLPAYNGNDNIAIIENGVATLLENSTSSKCQEQVRLFLGEAGLRNGTMWALKMLDASTKIPSGILMGNRVDLGMYDECVNIRERVANGSGEHEDIRGRHCMYKIGITFAMGNDTPPVNLELTLSICLPSSCEAGDIVDMMKMALESIMDLVPMENAPMVNVTGATCSSLVSPDWTTGGIITLLGFSLLLLFLVLCTILDSILAHTKILQDSSLSNGHRLDSLRKFSILKNASRILDTKMSSQTLPALQGIRFFSMCWVIFGHEYFMSLIAPTVNLADLVPWVTSWGALYILIAPFAVDTFFTLSGFLMGYLFLKEMSTGRRFNIFAYYIHRYLRLTPALAALILITIFFIPRFGSGAIWESSTGALEYNCRRNWWPLLLYVQNYVDKEHLWCLPHTWYLATEMHYFLVSPLILYPLARKPSIGLVILAIAFVASVATPTVASYQNKYSSFLFTNGQMAPEAIQSFYMDSRNRAAPWLLGIFIGYLVFVKKAASNAPTRRAVKWIGWLSAIAAFLFCFFSMRHFQSKDYEYNAAWEIFHVIVSKPLWSGAVGWIVYASIFGFGGPIGRFLSLPIFQPFSRISYSVYLVHFMIQLIKICAYRTPRYFSQFNLFNEFLSDTLLCVFVAFVFTLVFESPIVILEKMIMQRGNGRRKLEGSKQQLNDEKFVTQGIDNPAVNIAA